MTNVTTRRNLDLWLHILFVPLCVGALAACAAPGPTDMGGGGGTGSGSGSNPESNDAGTPPPGPDAAGQECPYVGPPLIDPAALGDECFTEAHCVPESFLPDPAIADFLGRCQADPMAFCVPDPFIEALGNYVPPTCRSIANAEGRCLSLAIPQVMEQQALIPQDICQTYERCVPCFNPLDGAETGACGIACDMPAEPPATLPKCCGDLGTCVPASAVPPDQASQLGEDTCPMGAGLLCAPDVFISGAPLQECEPSIASIFGATTGACVPACVPAVEEMSDFLDQDGCPDAMLCVPCDNPLDGTSTGVCDPAMP